jgi:thiol:disulfide interchange protein DsbD
MDRETFKDPQVIALLRQFDLIRIDVTQNQPEDLALLHRFHLIGPPGVILFDRDGQEDLQHRVIGYMESSAFQEVLRKVLQ